VHLAADLAMHIPNSSVPPPFTVAVTGATGLIGTALVERLRSRGHAVRRLVRETTRADMGEDVPWNPETGELDPAALEGVKAVIHLAGEPIARRWTAARRRAIRESRVKGTELIARTIAAMPEPPTVLLSGSAVGYYGDRGDELLDEGSSAGRDFLAGVAEEWESAAQPASRAGVRVAYLRTGIVLSAKGGALAKLLLPFKLGLGGPIGGGRQWMSWISLEDHLRAIDHALATDGLRGPVNLVAPNPVTNAEFASTLGRVLARPAVLPLPQFALQLVYGDMADATILAGQRAMPRALAATRFEFMHPTLEQALRAAVGR
jgi:uncharacterized protein (TIGR01777 family)